MSKKQIPFFVLFVLSMIFLNVAIMDTLEFFHFAGEHKGFPFTANFYLFETQMQILSFKGILLTLLKFFFILLWLPIIIYSLKEYKKLEPEEEKVEI